MNEKAYIGGAAQYDPRANGQSNRGLDCRVDKSPETIGNKLGELNAGMSELLAQASRLANSLAGCEPEEPSNACPVSSDVLSQLEGLRRLGRDINRQLVRANQAVGN